MGERGDTAVANWARSVGLSLGQRLITDQLPSALRFCILGARFRLQSFDEPVSFS
jgi:hypothetical protein